MCSVSHQGEKSASLPYLNNQKIRNCIHFQVLLATFVVLALVFYQLLVDRSVALTAKRAGELIREF